MFRLIRLLMFTAIAFVTGLLYERFQQAERCRAAGGQQVGELCMEAEIDG
jgi:hypothetical protein